MEQAESIVLGSGFFAAGFALSHPGTRVFEAQQLADAAFSPSMEGYGAPRPDALSEAGAALADKMTKAGFFGEVSDDIAKCELILSSFCREEKTSVLFSTVLTGVEAAPGGYRVSLFAVDGEREYLTRRVIDARVSTAGDRYRVVLDGVSKPLDPWDFVGGTCSCFGGLPGGRAVLTFAFDRNVTPAEARLCAVRSLSEHLPEGARILHMALICGLSRYPAPTVGEDGIVRVDERAFAHPLAAFESGVNFQ